MAQFVENKIDQDAINKADPANRRALNKEPMTAELMRSQLSDIRKDANYERKVNARKKSRAAQEPNNVAAYQAFCQMIQKSHEGRHYSRTQIGMEDSAYEQMVAYKALAEYLNTVCWADAAADFLDLSDNARNLCEKLYIDTASFIKYVPRLLAGTVATVALGAVTGGVGFYALNKYLSNTTNRNLLERLYGLNTDNSIEYRVVVEDDGQISWSIRNEKEITPDQEANQEAYFVNNLIEWLDANDYVFDNTNNTFKNKNDPADVLTNEKFQSMNSPNNPDSFTKVLQHKTKVNVVELPEIVEPSNSPRP